MAASRDIVRSWETVSQGGEVAWAPEGLSADDLLVQAFTMLAGKSNSQEMAWSPMNVAETVKWLQGHLLQGDSLDIGSFYVKI